MKRQYAVIGLGRFGSSLARELMTLGYEVLGIDKYEEKVNDIEAYLTHAIVAETTDEEVLRSVGIRNMDCVIVAIGDSIQASILTTIILKDLGVKNVVVKALSEQHGRVLEKLGVDRIIYPERDMGIRVAHQLANPNLLDYIELSKEYTVAELVIPKALSGKTLKELDPRARYGCSVVAIHREDKMIVVPAGNELVQEKDVMVLIGKKKQIDSFESEVVNR